MKYGNTYFLQLSRKLFEEPYCNLSQNAKWLYIVLNELEQKFCNGSENSRDFFFRTNEDLAKDCQMSLPTFKKAKKELIETDLIEHWQSHFFNKETKKKSEKHVSVYRIL